MRYELEVKPRPTNKLHVGRESKRRTEINQVVGLTDGREGGDTYYCGDDLEGTEGAKTGEGEVSSSYFWT